MGAAQTDRAGVSFVKQKYVPAFALSDLTPHPQNPNRGDLALIAESVAATGFYGAIVVQKSSNRILAGEHRWRALVAEGAKTGPVMIVDVDDETAVRILLVDNEATRKGQNDDESLASLLQECARTDAGLLGTGYDESDLEGLLAKLEAAPPAEFPMKNETIDTAHECHKCGYAWSGQSS